jgi:cytochrome c oxidase cbb3-type subunit 4
MDINDMRALITLLAFITFLGIVFWAYHHKSRRNFDEAAQLPFADDGADDSVPDGRAAGRTRHK